MTAPNREETARLYDDARRTLLGAEPVLELFEQVEGKLEPLAVLTFGWLPKRETSLETGEAKAVLVVVEIGDPSPEVLGRAVAARWKGVIRRISQGESPVNGLGIRRYEVGAIVEEA